MATETFPTKPRLKPPSKTPSKSPESSYWKSFKPLPSDQTPNLTSTITSLTYSPTNPALFAATHGASLSFFNPFHPFTPSQPTSTIHSFKDLSYSPSFRSDGLLIAASSLAGTIHVFETRTLNQLRILKGHTRAVKAVKYPVVDRLHLFSGGDDALVKYWDVATETCLSDFVGHKDYVRCGSVSPVDDGLFASGGYDHTVRLWDVRGGGSGKDAVMVFDHGKQVEDVTFLPSGGMVATAGGNVVKIWDVIGGGKCVCTMEGHNKAVTSICVGKVGRNGGIDGLDQFRLLSVSLDGYMKVFDYAKMKVTSSVRFRAPLVSVAVAPDGSSRVIGTSNGIIYMGRRKREKVEEGGKDKGDVIGFRVLDEQQRRGLKPSFFRYFQRGQSEKPREGDYLVLRPKQVKLGEHDKLLKKFRHKDALVAVLKKKNPDNVVAVMEELVARKKLFKSVSNLDVEELEVLLAFLQKYTSLPRYAGLLMPFANKVVQMRGEDIRANDALKVHMNNFKRSIQEELRIQQSLLEIQGVISPLMRIAGRR